MAAFTAFHVALSLVGIVTGFVVVVGMLNSAPLERWTAIFLATTAATSITGFFFPVHRLMPSHVLGLLSLAVLAPTLYARYRHQLSGSWRWVYGVGAVIALYFNCFVLIAQSFAKIPALKAMAPTQSEPPFVVAQAGALVIFGLFGIGVARRFRPDGIAASESAEPV